MRPEHVESQPSLGQERLPARPSGTRHQQPSAEQQLTNLRHRLGALGLLAEPNGKRIELALATIKEDFKDVYRKEPTTRLSLRPTPYVTHLYEVADRVASVTPNADVVLAALLHDSIEDVPERWDRKKLAQVFGERVALLVDFVTHQDTAAPWEKRNTAYLTRLKDAPVDSVVISLCDKIANMKSYTRLMERGFPIESIAKKGFQDNLMKFVLLHSLALQRGMASGDTKRLIIDYGRTLEDFVAAKQALDARAEQRKTKEHAQRHGVQDDHIVAASDELKFSVRIRKLIAETYFPTENEPRTEPKGTVLLRLERVGRPGGLLTEPYVEAYIRPKKSGHACSTQSILDALTKELARVHRSLESRYSAELAAKRVDKALKTLDASSVDCRGFIWAWATRMDSMYGDPRPCEAWPTKKFYDV